MNSWNALSEAERSPAQRTLEEQVRHLQRLLAASPVIVYSSRPSDGAITFISENVTRQMGYEPSEFTEAQGFWIAHVHPEDSILVESRLEHILEPEPRILEYRFLHKDGAYRWMRDEVAVIRDAEGQPQEFVGSWMNVTERRRMGEELKRSQRLEAAGRIAGQVAHEFNNLLSPVLGYPLLIKRMLPADHPALRACDAIHQAAEKMAQISEDLLILGRQTHLNLQPVDLNRLIHDAMSALALPLAQMEVLLHLKPDLMLLSGSAPHLMRVIMNLVTNACDAMSNRGRLTICTANVYLDRPFALYNRVEIGEYVRLEISDNGPGVAPEIRDRIFDAYFTTKHTGKRSGSGLGLSVVHAVVSDHRGYVDVQSEPVQGTTFSVYLPVSREMLHEQRRMDLPAGQGELILVMDDDPGQRAVLETMLRSLHYRVETVSGSKEAVAYLQEHEPDLLLIDLLTAPGSDGAETFRRAIEIRPALRAITMSGTSDLALIEKIQTLGAKVHLNKPIQLAPLAVAIRAELGPQPGRSEGPRAERM